MERERGVEELAVYIFQCLVLYSSRSFYAKERGRVSGRVFFTFINMTVVQATTCARQVGTALDGIKEDAWFLY